MFCLETTGIHNYYRFEISYQKNPCKLFGLIDCPRILRVKDRRKVQLAGDLIDPDRECDFIDGSLQEYKLAATVNHTGTFTKGHYYTHSYINETRVTYSDSKVKATFDNY